MEAAENRKRTNGEQHIRAGDSDRRSHPVHEKASLKQTVRSFFEVCGAGPQPERVVVEQALQGVDHGIEVVVPFELALNLNKIFVQVVQPLGNEHAYRVGHDRR